MKKVRITVTQRLLSGTSQLRLVVDGEVTTQAGSDEDVAGMLLEAERHGNDGKARIYIDALK